MRTVIFNLSGVYEDQGLVLGSSETVDFTGLDGTVCYCDDASAEVIRDRMRQMGLHDGRCPDVCWIDSGDYHYMSLFRTESISEPFQILLVDHHPDMQEPLFGDVISCGGWLRLLAGSNPNLKRITIVGMNPDLRQETEGFEDMVGDRIADDLPVFISVDKDALSQDYARTNWDQGEMTLQELETLLEESISGKKVLGVDICGEKPSSKGGDPEDMSINRRANLRIHKVLSDLLG